MPIELLPRVERPPQQKQDWWAAGSRKQSYSASPLRCDALHDCGNESKSGSILLRVVPAPCESPWFYLSTYAIPALAVAGLVIEVFRALDSHEKQAALIVGQWCRPLAEIVFVFGVLMVAQQWPEPREARLADRALRSILGILTHALAFIPFVGITPNPWGYAVAIGVGLAYLFILWCSDVYPYPTSGLSLVCAISAFCVVNVL